MTQRSPRPLFLAALAGVAIAAGAATGCGSTSSSSADASSDAPKVAKTSSANGVTLRVGVQKDGIRSLLATSGVLKGAPFKVEYSVFAFGPPLVEAAGANKIDVAAVGNTPPIFGAAAKSNFRVVATNQFKGKQDDFLLTRDRAVTKPADLKGKNIGVAKGSSAHGLLLNVMERVGLEPGDVKISFLAPADGLSAFKTGRIDAWSVWAPYSTQGEQAGGRSIAGGPPDEHGTNFSIASAKAVGDPKRAAAIKDYLARLRKAYTWADTHRDEFAVAWSKETGLPEKVTKAAAPDKLVEIRQTTQGDIDNQQKLADLLAEKKVIPAKVQFDSIVTKGLGPNGGQQQ